MGCERLAEKIPTSLPRSRTGCIERALSPFIWPRPLPRRERTDPGAEERPTRTYREQLPLLSRKIAPAAPRRRRRGRLLAGGGGAGARCLRAQPSLRGAIGRRKTPVFRRAIGTKQSRDKGRSTIPGLLRFARNDGRGSTQMQSASRAASAPARNARRKRARGRARQGPRTPIRERHPRLWGRRRTKARSRQRD